MDLSWLQNLSQHHSWKVRTVAQEALRQISDRSNAMLGTKPAEEGRASSEIDAMLEGATPHAIAQESTAANAGEPDEDEQEVLERSLQPIPRGLASRCSRSRTHVEWHHTKTKGRQDFRSEGSR